jgi:hypothetical protein
MLLSVRYGASITQCVRQFFVFSAGVGANNLFNNLLNIITPIVLKDG